MRAKKTTSTRRIAPQSKSVINISEIKTPQEKAEKDKLDKARQRLRNAMKKDLLKQLSDNKIKGRHYADLVDDYLTLFDIKNMLIDDIELHGVSKEYKNGENQYGYKKNDSITELTRVNNQMLKILADLGLKAADIEIQEEYEEL